ncbi:MAG TPA: DUF177 domain-containing protein [Paenibacillaceae bacterium]
MQLEVQSLLAKGEPVHLRESLDVAPLLAGMRDTEPIGPMEAELTARPAGGLIEVSGRLTGRIRLACSRCLAPLEETYDIPYAETFKPVPEGREAKEDEESDIVPFSGSRLELRPYLESELLLHLPLAPLCDEACRGLCPECGQNLNEHECGCRRERIDPRLEALRKLLDGGQNEEA